MEAQGIGFQSLKDMLTVAGQNLQRSYTLKLGTLQETVTSRSARGINEPGGQRYARGGTEAVQPEKSECVASPDGGRIVPPKKIRDAQSVLPVGAARRLD